MTGYGGSQHLDDQPGLEVNYQAGLEVDMRNTPAREAEGLQPIPYQDVPETYEQKGIETGTSTHGSYYTGYDHSSPGQQTAALSNYEGQPSQNVPTTEASTKPPKRRRKIVWIIIAVVAVLVVIGAVLGGVLGSRASHSTSSSSASGISTSNSTSLNNIRPTSSLAVTGWRDGDKYRIRLFYQGPDQELRMSTYASNQTSWSDPIVLTDLEYPAGNNSSLASATSVEGDPVQIKLFYIDNNSVLRGQGYEDYLGATEQGARLTINDYPMIVPSGSRLNSYWPFIVSQESSGAFRWYTYHGPGGELWWTNDTLSLIGSPSAGMVVLPASAWYFQKGGMAYRRSDGKMMTYLTDTNNNDTGTAWGTDNLSQSIPNTAAIGGFAVARPNDSNNQTNTYLLYQDDSGTIQLVWQDDASGWKGPTTYDAFSGADNGTDIACLTAAAWDASGIELSNSQDMNRCYFQVGNKVREVYYDGTNWNNKGYLPIT